LKVTVLILKKKNVMLSSLKCVYMPLQQRNAQSVKVNRQGPYFIWWISFDTSQCYSTIARGQLADSSMLIWYLGWQDLTKDTCQIKYSFYMTGQTSDKHVTIWSYVDNTVLSFREY